MKRQREQDNTRALMVTESERYSDIKKTPQTILYAL